MKILFFLSIWLQIWSILYYIKFIKIPPLYELLVIAFIISTSLFIISNGFNNLIILLFIIITHLFPLYIVDKKYDNTTIIINFKVLFSYILFMSYHNLDIFDFYKKSLLVSKKSIKELLNFTLN